MSYKDTVIDGLMVAPAVKPVGCWLYSNVATAVGLTVTALEAAVECVPSDPVNVIVTAVLETVELNVAMPEVILAVLPENNEPVFGVSVTVPAEIFVQMLPKESNNLTLKAVQVFPAVTGVDGCTFQLKLAPAAGLTVNDEESIAVRLPELARTV